MASLPSLVRAFSFAGLSAGFFPACTGLEPCFTELSEGDSLGIRLGQQAPAEIADGSNWEPDACMQAYGIEPEEEFQALVETFGGDRICLAAAGPVTAFGDWDLEWDESVRPDGGHLFSSIFRFSRVNDECTGRLELRVNTDSLPTSSWDGNGTPPGFAWVIFEPDVGNGDCPVPCAVRFAASSSIQSD